MDAEYEPWQSQTYFSDRFLAGMKNCESREFPLAILSLFTLQGKYK